VTFSHVSTGGHLTFIGGDYKPQLNLQLEVIELDLEAKADPLPRLLWSSEEQAKWISRRQKYLREKLTPPPTSFLYSDLVRLHTDKRNYDEDKEEFEARLAAHLAECRKDLLRCATARVYRMMMNSVRFAVSNPTQVPMKDVRVVAAVKAPGVSVLSSEPKPSLMPKAPTWPDITDDLAWKQYAFPTPSMVASAPPLSVIKVEVHRNGDDVQIVYRMGHLYAGESQTTPRITMVPNLAAAKELNVTVSAGAIDRKGVKEMGILLPVKNEGWTLETLVDPAY
jgi:hypothetical protein